jgi:hypothetical protein
MLASHCRPYLVSIDICPGHSCCIERADIQEGCHMPDADALRASIVFTLEMLHHIDATLLLSADTNHSNILLSPVVLLLCIVCLPCWPMQCTSTAQSALDTVFTPHPTAVQVGVALRLEALVACFFDVSSNATDCMCCVSIY